MVRSSELRPIVFVCTAACVLVVGTLFAQQGNKAASNEKTVTKMVTDIIRQYHVSQKPVDDRISLMLFKRQFKDLDPAKLYFMQSDIDELNRFQNQLDDQLKAGNVEFIHLLFDRYRQRVEERVATAHQLIDLPHDFTLDEVMSTDTDNATWATSQAEVNERWRKKVKYELLSMKLEKTSLEDARKRLHKRYDTLKRNAKDTEDGEILEMYLTTFAHCFDPHTAYMSPQSDEDFKIQMNLKLEGIGAALRSEDGVTTVANVVAGGAAKEDGRLKAGDKIIAVAQEDGDFVDIVEMKLSKVVRLIRGPKGTKVRLKVVSAGSEPVVYELTRKQVELEDQAVRGEIIQAGDRIPGGRARIGVVNIPSFYHDFDAARAGVEGKSTAQDVQKVLERFRAEGGVDGLIVDLRMNGGGALNEAVDVTGLFIDRGPVVQIKDANHHIKSFKDDERGVAYSGPLVVVCNRLSASASEIFAAAIRDYGRGIVIGDISTHGKGTVQNLMPVANEARLFAPRGGKVKVTNSQFYRVNGDSTQNKGVESDIALPSLLDHLDLGEASLENALAFDHIPPVEHVMYDQVDEKILRTLREASQTRVDAEPKFQQVKKDIETYLAKKAKKQVSLNEATLLAEREEDKAAKELEKEEEDRENPSKDKPIFPKNEYNREVLHIALDYAVLLKQGGRSIAQAK